MSVKLRENLLARYCTINKAYLKKLSTLKATVVSYYTTVYPVSASVLYISDVNKTTKPRKVQSQ